MPGFHRAFPNSAHVRRIQFDLVSLRQASQTFPPYTRGYYIKQTEEHDWSIRDLQQAIRRTARLLKLPGVSAYEVRGAALLQNQILYILTFKWKKIVRTGTRTTQRSG
ncbi:MAG TPA: hypothetical protein DIT99_13665 [Candidatus Latescibacteria bacterium]|nr:hypothetical protein [Candidatus Latescibacterota bacterium]